MKRKFKFFGIASIAIIVAIGFYLWGEHAAQTGSGIEIVAATTEPNKAMETD